MIKENVVEDQSSKQAAAYDGIDEIIKGAVDQIQQTLKDAKQAEEKP